MDMALKWTRTNRTGQSIVYQINSIKPKIKMTKSTTNKILIALAGLVVFVFAIYFVPNSRSEDETYREALLERLEANGIQWEIKNKEGEVIKKQLVALELQYIDSLADQDKLHNEANTLRELLGQDFLQSVNSQN
jgi:hypothetical protein